MNILLEIQHIVIIVRGFMGLEDYTVGGRLSKEKRRKL